MINFFLLSLIVSPIDVDASLATSHKPRLEQRIQANAGRPQLQQIDPRWISRKRSPVLEPPRVVIPKNTKIYLPQTNFARKRIGSDAQVDEVNGRKRNGFERKRDELQRKRDELQRKRDELQRKRDELERKRRELQRKRDGHNPVARKR